MENANKRIPAAIVKAEGLLGVFAVYATPEVVCPDCYSCSITREEVALAKALFPYWDHGEGTDVYWEIADTALRAVLREGRGAVIPLQRAVGGFCGECHLWSKGFACCFCGLLHSTQRHSFPTSVSYPPPCVGNVLLCLGCGHGLFLEVST